MILFLSTDLPLTDPVLKFFLILVIILVVPIVSEKIKVPQLLGLIITGIIIGPYGLNLMLRDSGIIMSGTAGLLYIMFMAGLEIDINDFKKNAGKSTFLGLAGFIIPMVIGTLSGIYIFKFSIITSILLASMFASHTLITYPIVSRLGITKNIAVNISVGSSLITNILALLVLAIIVGLTTGQITNLFWVRLSVSLIVFYFTITFGFPVVARWFFKRFSDNVSQYIFVLAMVFFASVLATIAGIESIIGAFLCGIALNRLIPSTSALMNRIDFVGNAIFIPFFLIGVGMLIDYKDFFNNFETFKVAIIMSIVATLGKFLAALLTQKTFKFSRDEFKLIFGLTNSQAAATLAAVLIGYNIILGYDSLGNAIRLLNDSVLNGTIIMILVTCTIASFVTLKGGQSISLTGLSDIKPSAPTEKILIPISNPLTIEELINLSTIIKTKSNTDGLYALSIVSNYKIDADKEHVAKKNLERAEMTASATDLTLTKLLRYDINIVNGILNTIKENNISDIVLGLHARRNITDTILGTLTENILHRSNVSMFIYKPNQPISTIKRHIIIIPDNAEHEPGFSFWIAKVWNIAMNTGSKIAFYASQSTINIIKTIHQKHLIDASFKIYKSYDDFVHLSKLLKPNDNLVIVMSRPNSPSYQNVMAKVPLYLNRYFQEFNFMLIYPMHFSTDDTDNIDLTNSSLFDAIEKIDILGKTISQSLKNRPRQQ